MTSTHVSRAFLESERIIVVLSLLTPFRVANSSGSSDAGLNWLLLEINFTGRGMPEGS